MKFQTAEQITKSFIKKGWNKKVSFKELTLTEAQQKGLTFAIDGIKKGKKYFVMNINNNIYDDDGEIAFFNFK